jgi:hypothetical protein
MIPAFSRRVGGKANYRRAVGQARQDKLTRGRPRGQSRATVVRFFPGTRHAPRAALDAARGAWHLHRFRLHRTPPGRQRDDPLRPDWRRCLLEWDRLGGPLRLPAAARDGRWWHLRSRVRLQVVSGRARGLWDREGTGHRRRARRGCRREEQGRRRGQRRTGRRRARGDDSQDWRGVTWPAAAAQQAADRAAPPNERVRRLRAAPRGPFQRDRFPVPASRCRHGSKDQQGAAARTAPGAFHDIFLAEGGEEARRLDPWARRGGQARVGPTDSSARRAEPCNDRGGRSVPTTAARDKPADGCWRVVKMDRSRKVRGRRRDFRGNS